MPSIVVRFTEAEAEALLLDPHEPIVPVDPVVRLRARGKISSALLARSAYVPPVVRVARQRLSR